MKKKTKKNKKKIEKNDITLIITFISLIVLVAALGLVALNLDNIYKNSSKDMIIPILEEHFESEFSVEVNDLSKGDTKEYIFVVTNNKEKNILDKEITYNIDIKPTENIEIELYKNGLLINTLSIEENKLKAGKKIEDTYKIVIKAKEQIKTKEKIVVNINS